MTCGSFSNTVHWIFCITNLARIIISRSSGFTNTNYKLHEIDMSNESTDINKIDLVDFSLIISLKLENQNIIIMTNCE